MFFQMDPRRVHNQSCIEVNTNRIPLDKFSYMYEMPNGIGIHNLQRGIGPASENSIAPYCPTEMFYGNSFEENYSPFKALQHMLENNSSCIEAEREMVERNIYAHFKEGGQAIHALFQRVVGTPTNSSFSPYCATSYAIENKIGTALALRDIEKPKVCPARPQTPIPTPSSNVLNPFTVLGGFFLLTSVMAACHYMKKYFQAQKSISKSDIKAIQSIRDFYSSASNEDTIGDYYNRFKVQGIEGVLANKKVHELITKEINFYSNVSLNSEVRKVCNEHVKVLKVLQKAASYKEGRALPILARIQTVATSAFLALMLKLPIDLYSGSLFTSFPLSLGTICFFPGVALISKLLSEFQISSHKEKQKKLSDFVLKQKDILFSSNLWGEVDFFGGNPWAGIDEDNSGIFRGILSSTFGDTKNKASELSEKLLLKN